jgi:hypothetical protein
MTFPFSENLFLDMNGGGYQKPFKADLSALHRIRQTG